MGTSLMSSNSMAAFEVLSYDLRLWESGRDHNTDDYQDNFVIRRGGAFNLTIKTKDFNPEKSKFHFELKTGDRPRKKDDTWVQIEKDPEKDRDDFFYEVTSKLDTEVRVKIWGPVTALVSAYRFALVDKASKKEYPIEKVLYIIFNPWNEQDEVYMRDADRRREYVLNDFGYVYWSGHKPKPWNFAQFTDEALRCTFKLLEMARRVGYRDTARDVARHISSAANSCDNYGLLVGNWTDDFSGGKKPWHWSGSRAIFKKYLETNSSVKYGQCWVFSGVTTSMMRCLGIPARSVTNYNSSHDCDGNCTDDKYFDEELNYLDECSYDSVWNFHVWNDVWMARPDLPEGYGGWQAIDATPQEESDHKMQCGPASLEAIRRGDIGLGYDCPFVFAEVNADVMHWGEDDESDWGWKRMKMNKYHIGRSILTKQHNKDDDFGDADKEDVLNEYKNAEGSAAERLAIHNAIRGSRRAQQYYDVKDDVKADVPFDLVELDKIEIGDPFSVKVVVRNDSKENRSISAALTARSIYYTGNHHTIIKKAEGKFQLGPKQQQDVALTVKYNEYWKKLVEGCLIKMYVICRVQETGQTFTEEDDFEVEKPKLEIKVPTEVKVRQPCEATFTFKNPLDVPLTELNLSVDGAGLMRPRNIDITGEIKPNAQFTHKVTFLPRVHGDRKIIASFNAKELFDISGVKSFVVKKK